MTKRNTLLRKPSVPRAIVNHPGKIIAMELEARGWTQKDLATIIQRPEQAISEIINGRKRVTAETAYALSSAFGVKEEFWLNLESNYQLFLAREHVKQQEIARRSELFSLAPVSEMLRRGWLTSSEKTTESLERAIEAFYGTSRPLESPYLSHLCLRKTESKEPEDISRIAWAVQVRHIASRKKIARFFPNNFDNLISDLLRLTQHPRQVSQVASVLEDYGLHLVLLEHLPKTYIDGAAFWMDGSPVIALTMRFDRLDYFWFTLMHELAHIKLGHNDSNIDESLENEPQSEEEREANNLSRNWLIQQSDFDKYVSLNSKPTKASVDQFAERISRHPSIIIGRLQRDGIIGYSSMRDYLPKVKQFLEME